MTPIACEGDGEQAGGHLLAGGDHGVVFARVMQRRGLAAPGDQLIGLAGHGRDHDGDLVAGVDLALDVARDVADAVDVGDGGSAEFHHEAGHDVPGTRRKALTSDRHESATPAAPKRRVYIPAGSKRRNQPNPYGEMRLMVTAKSPHRSTVDADEVARFSSAWPRPGGTRAARWRLLHKFNPVRLAYIRDQAAACISPAIRNRLDSLTGLAHPRHRLRRRHPVASRWRGWARRWSAPIRPPPISRPRKHARDEAGVAIDYRATTAESLADAGERFDMVLAMEVVEHVADVELFVRAAPRW